MTIDDRTMDRLAKLEALREALVWWDECSYGYSDNGWAFWFDDDADNELELTVNAAWAEVERLLRETDR